jgi:hypothetical protein
MCCHSLFETEGKTEQIVRIPNRMGEHASAIRPT